MYVSLFPQKDHLIPELKGQTTKQINLLRGVKTLLVLKQLTVGGDRALLSCKNCSRVTISLPGEDGRREVGRWEEREAGVASQGRVELRGIRDN